MDIPEKQIHERYFTWTYMPTRKSHRAKVTSSVAQKVSLVSGLFRYSPISVLPSQIIYFTKNSILFTFILEYFVQRCNKNIALIAFEYF